HRAPPCPRSRLAAPPPPPRPHAGLAAPTLASLPQRSPRCPTPRLAAPRWPRCPNARLAAPTLASLFGLGVEWVLGEPYGAGGLRQRGRACLEFDALGWAFVS